MPSPSTKQKMSSLSLSSINRNSLDEKQITMEVKHGYCAVETRVVIVY